MIALRIAGIREPRYHSMANLSSRLCHAVRRIAPDYSSARGGTPYEVDACDLCAVKDCAMGSGRCPWPRS